MAARSTAPKSGKAVNEAKKQARRERMIMLGQLLRIARGDYTQSQMAEMLGRVRGERILQTSISRWEKGEIDLSLELARDIEQALGLDKGSIAISAGYVDTDVSVPVAIRQDPTIHPNFRGDLERIYKSYQEHSRQLEEAESRATRSTRSARR